MSSAVDWTEATRAAVEYLRLGNYPTFYMPLQQAKAGPEGSWVVVFRKAFSAGQITVTVDPTGKVVEMVAQ